MIDYLIVGSGLAGISFAEEALAHGKSIVVIDDASQNSSRIAGGFYNPVILKRFSEVWQAKEQLEVMDEFYIRLEHKLDQVFNYKMPILRKFFSVEEQNNWFIASDKISLEPFLSTKLVTKKYNGIDSPYDYGEVLHTGYVDTLKLLEAYHLYLKSIDSFLEERFDYNSLEIKSNAVVYKSLEAKNLVFAEGFGLSSNPFFNDLPLDGTKGELFIIKAPRLNLDVIVNTSVFILPLGDGLFKVGATYNWSDKTAVPTEEGKIELIARIEEIINCDFEIMAHFAGVRPTVKDRRPLLGAHHTHKQLHILNGLGTRGVLLGPAMAKDLFNYIENKEALNPLVDIYRFYKKRN